MSDINYISLKAYAERLAEAKGISINKAMKQILKYHRWKNKKRK